MRSRRRGAPAALFVVFISLSFAASLRAQGARDSLAAGRHAYERADLDAAVHLLQIGLASGANARDTLWVGGAHMLTDALLEQGKDTLAALWAKWALRSAPAMRIDSTAYPPRVARSYEQARTAIGTTAPGDTVVATTLEPLADAASGRSMLRFARGGTAGAIAVVENVGTMLPGESRAMSPGTYTLRISADGYQAVSASREVLPGFATIVTPRLARNSAGAAAAAAPGSGNQPPGTAATGPTGAGASRAIPFASAGGTACALVSGITMCWGDNRTGQLGAGIGDSAHAPVRVAGGQSFRTISVGATHACGLTAAGQAWCWGQGTNGELGNGRTVASATPLAVSGVPVLVTIGTGTAHTCALTASGAVYCWGSNRSGELGARGAEQSATPLAVTAPSGVSFTTLWVGPSHSCALAANGTLYCWGDNSSGQIGNGSTSNAETPAVVQTPVPLKSVALGTSHTCGLAATGAAWCWGSNTSGQLGLGAAAPQQVSRPSQVSDALVFTALAAGEAHSCGLREDGAVFCWGSGRSGQLGNGQQTDSPRPVLVVGGQVFRAIGVGGFHSCGLDADGNAWCWGDNAVQQLGAVAARSSAVPVPVLARPQLHALATGATAPRSLFEAFDDGNWTAAPAWLVDSAPGAALAMTDRALEIARGRSGRYAGPGAGLALPVRIPVRFATQIRFDVMVLADSLRSGCGLSCASWPASVRVRVKNTDLTESEVWYV
ncbi:MAG: RCC1 domain-containing protein, partial [Gemmatimonadales bacterium]